MVNVFFFIENIYNEIKGWLMTLFFISLITFFTIVVFSCITFDKKSLNT